MHQISSRTSLWHGKMRSSSPFVAQFFVTVDASNTVKAIAAGGFVHIGCMVTHHGQENHSVQSGGDWPPGERVHPVELHMLHQLLERERAIIAMVIQHHQWRIVEATVKILQTPHRSRLLPAHVQQFGFHQIQLGKV